MVEAIIVIGWRSDSGAYLVDSYPEGIEIDEQDLTNLFSLHRLAANGVMERAGPDFNFLRLSDGITLVSWYSGFRTTKFLARPNFCVALVLDAGENANIWEEPLHTICYNVLTKLEDNDFIEYLQEVLDTINEGYMVEPLPGYPGLNGENEPEESIMNVSIEKQTSSTNTKPPEPLSTDSGNFDDDEFSDLLALAEEQAKENQAYMPGSTASTTTMNTDPFASSPDPFANSPDPFSSNPSSTSNSPSTAFSPSTPKSAFSPPSSNSATFTPKTNPLSNATIVPEGPSLADQVIQELQNLDRTTPQRPKSTSDTARLEYLEKKVLFLEQKLNIYGKLIRAYQTKELELKEKNELIAKLLVLLS